MTKSLTGANHLQAINTIYQYTCHNCICCSEEKVEHFFHRLKPLQEQNLYLFQFCFASIIK